MVVGSAWKILAESDVPDGRHDAENIRAVLYEFFEWLSSPEGSAFGYAIGKRQLQGASLRAVNIKQLKDLIEFFIQST